VIVGDVAARVDSPADIDWITAVGSEAWERPRQPSARPGLMTEPLLVIGGCDLEAMVSYLRPNVPVVKDFNFVATNKVFVHRDHTALLRQTVAGLSDEALTIADRLPFLPRDVFTTSLGTRHFGAVVFSPLMDFTQGVYRSRSTGLVATYGSFNRNLTDSGTWDWAVASLPSLAAYGDPLEFLAWFTEEFEFLGAASPEEVVTNLRWLRDEVLPTDTRLLVLTAAEVHVPDAPSYERGREIEHARYNAALETFAATTPGVSLVDVRTVVRTRADVTDNIRHYSRRAAMAIAGLLSAALS
jgi:hypothetical protein